MNSGDLAEFIQVGKRLYVGFLGKNRIFVVFNFKTRRYGKY